MEQLVYVPVILGAAVLFVSPSITAVIRGTDLLWAVILLNVTTWLGAWVAVIVLPRKRSVPVRHALPIRDDPRYLYGAVPPPPPAGASRLQDSARSGATVWS